MDFFPFGFISANIIAGDAYLKTDCINGKRGVVSVKMFGVGVDVGVSWFGPFTLESAPIKCEAPMDPNAFTGRFSISNIAVTFYAVGGMVMGSALCDLMGLQVSTDLLVVSNAIYGKSWGRGKIEDCCE